MITSYSLEQSIMKLKFTQLFAGAIAAATIAATPLVAFAQGQSSDSPPRITFNGEQQAKFEQIQKTAFTAIEAVLEPAQKAQFVAERETMGIRALQNLESLNENQKSKIGEILQRTNLEIGRLLTQEQKDQIREWQMRNQPNQPNDSK
jgi:hypothetical protein